MGGEGACGKRRLPRDESETGGRYGLERGRAERLAGRVRAARAQSAVRLMRADAGPDGGPEGTPRSISPIYTRRCGGADGPLPGAGFRPDRRPYAVAGRGRGGTGLPASAGVAGRAGYTSATVGPGASARGHYVGGLPETHHYTKLHKTKKYKITHPTPPTHTPSQRQTTHTPRAPHHHPATPPTPTTKSTTPHPPEKPDCSSRPVGRGVPFEKLSYGQVQGHYAARSVWTSFWELVDFVLDGGGICAVLGPKGVLRVWVGWCWFRGERVDGSWGPFEVDLTTPPPPGCLVGRGNRGTAGGSRARNAGLWGVSSGFRALSDPDREGVCVAITGGWRSSMLASKPVVSGRFRRRGRSRTFDPRGVDFTARCPEREVGGPSGWCPRPQRSDR